MGIRNSLIFLAGGLCLTALSLVADEVALPKAVWLTYQRNQPVTVMVNWSSDNPEPSVVLFGETPECKGRAIVKGSRMLHHVELPLPKQNAPLYYRLETGGGVTPSVQFKGLPKDELRIAMVADWGNATADISALLKDEPHLLVSGGDHIPRLHGSGLQGDVSKMNLLPHLKLIKNYPDLFRHIPFMPVLGNHDREIRPRGPLSSLSAPVYDVDAGAYLEIFPLPGDGWRWFFDMPGFNLRLIGLDLNHVSDAGTLLQSCHDYRAESLQLRWFRNLMLYGPRPPLIITLYNEKNSTVRGLVQGEWGQLIRRGTVAASGFGYFGERADERGIPWYNTSLNGKGHVYKDSFSEFLTKEDNYLLFTLERGASQIKVEIKRLDDGVSLDSQLWPKARLPKQ